MKLSDKQRKAVERAANLALKEEIISLYETDSRSGDSWTYRARCRFLKNSVMRSYSWMLFSVPKNGSRRDFDALKAETMAIFQKVVRARPSIEMKQMSFEDARDCRTRLDRAFDQYHAANPLVYELFRKFALMAKAAGHSHYSARAIYHRMRWHVDIETRGDEFKLNNNYSSRYARLLIREHPEFDGFFETRKLRS